MSTNRLRVGLVYDLRTDYLAEGYSLEETAEFDAEVTIDGLADAIRAANCDVERIGHGRALCARLVRGDRWDLVFSIAEGLHGRCREAQVPALLELYGIPYTFSDPLVCAATLDKSIAKRLVRDAGLVTPEFAVVADEDAIDAVSLVYPVFAKPLAEGTGKGVDRRSHIATPAELREVCTDLLRTYRQPVLVERYLPGREFTTAILGTGAEAFVLGSMEIRLRDNAGTTDYSYEMKERCDEFVDYWPLRDDPLRDAIEALALGSYRALECRDGGRVDMRLDDLGRPAFMEINPLPGMNPVHSDLPMIATQQGWTFDRLVATILESACRRNGLR